MPAGTYDERVPVKALICGATAEAELVRQGLADLGVYSIACADVSSAMENLRRRKYAAVVVDTSDAGLGFLRDIRELASSRTSIVIALSSVQEAGLSFRHGATFVFEQPVSQARMARGLRVAHSLMMREQDRYRRLTVDFAANVDTGGRVMEGAVTNLSEGGMAIQLPYRVECRTAIGWSLRLPGESSHLAGVGQVMWSDDTGKAGVMFTDLSLASRVLLTRWLRNMRMQ